MFIKYGNKQNLKRLMENGEIYFNPCKYFRDLETTLLKKGQADNNDGGISGVANNVFADSNNINITLGKTKTSIIVDPALSTPVFCLRKSDNEYITNAYYNELKEQFPHHTHALIIKDETIFKENIRYCFRNRAFQHDIYYQDEIFKDFIMFLKSGTSDTLFYEPRRKNNYYMKITINLSNDKNESFNIYIDDTNYYRTMFKKETFFKDQLEYRIVLPYEKITEGKSYHIEPFKAEIKCIEDLIR